MCGIAAIFDAAGGPVAEAALRAMTDAQAHRGPDDSGVFSAPGIGLGSRRLSILDLSERGHMPMADPDSGAVIVHNGEVYNYLEVAAELGLGDLRSGTDTEVVLRAWAKEGPACLARLNGIYAFAIWEPSRRRLTCVRDRLGVKPLLYARHEGRLLVASEVRALFAAGVTPQPDAAVLRDYLMAGVYDHGEGTFFDGVRQVPPGHCLVADDAGVRIEPYWRLDPAAEHDGRADEAGYREAVERFRELALDAVKLQLRSDVPVAVHVSGGLDSTLLMAAINRLQGEQGLIEAFSYAYGEPRYDETPYIDSLTQQLGWRAGHVTVDAPEVPALAKEAMLSQEQPFPGVVTLAKHKLIRETRDSGATVILEGQGGDEIGGGYLYYLGAHVHDLIRTGRPAEALAEVRALGRVNGEDDAWAMEKAFSSLAAFYRPGWSADGTRFLRDDCLDPGFSGAAWSEPAFPAQFRADLLNMQFKDIFHTKLPRILRSCDRASMAWSRELRVPLLDHRLVEFAFALPGTWKFRGGAQRSFMRDAVTGLLDTPLAAMPKRTVVDPQRDWLQGPLRSWAAELFASRSFRERGLFDPAKVDRAFADYCAEERPANAFHLWQWISVELWHRAFIDGAAS